MRIFLPAFLFLLAAASAPAQQLLDRFKPKEPSPMPSSTDATAPSEVTTGPVEPQAEGGPTLKGLIFAGDSSQLKSGGAAPSIAVQIKSVPILGGDDFAGKMGAFLGKPISLDLVNAIAAETARYFADHDHPVVSVVAPEQDVTEGVIQFVVTEARIGEVRVAGNKHFDSRHFTTRLEPGEPVIMSTLEADTAFYGRNPFHNVVAELSPGADSGETDITLRVLDQFPLRLYTGYEDSGVPSTGEDRLYAGFNWGNVLGLDHQLSYQYTTDTEFDRLRAHSATYTIPLPWKHLLSISGTYAQSDPSLGQDFDMSGETWEVSARYTLPLRKLGRLTHEAHLAYDFKSTDNNLQFGGLEVFDTAVEISQFSAGYQAALPDKLGRTTLALRGVYSPGGMSSHNDDEAFDAARAGSQSEYWYGTLGIDRVTRLPFDLTWALSANGQIADGNLQSTEQFLLGGYATVRGYDELAASGDSGVFVRNEIYTPAIPLLRTAGIDRFTDRLQLLAFHDFGVASVADPLDGEDENVQLQSVGVGLRWQFEKNLSLRFDYGWQIDDIGLADNSRAHLGVTVSY
jgi:hemolysin activation/secretion protein